MLGLGRGGEGVANWLEQRSVPCKVTFCSSKFVSASVDRFSDQSVGAINV